MGAPPRVAGAPLRVAGAPLRVAGAPLRIAGIPLRVIFPTFYDRFSPISRMSGELIVNSE
jgi:hypothetical protein